ncbi:MAG: plasmid pRiA4b ORF-3 family protein [Syntrophobacteraceae bacterium]
MDAKSKKSNLPSLVFQLKVILKGIEPAIWRSILVPGSITLHKFHKILQIVMGWDEEHLYNFSRRKDYERRNGQIRSRLPGRREGMST